MKKDKKKKEKITYVDDGRTVVDMSQLGGRRKNDVPRKEGDHSLRAQWRTYIDSVKLMILPMLCVIGIIFLAFLILYLISLTQL